MQISILTFNKKVEFEWMRHYHQRRYPEHSQYVLAHKPFASVAKDLTLNLFS
jgi:hypothetical protein